MKRGPPSAFSVTSLPQRGQPEEIRFIHSASSVSRAESTHAKRLHNRLSSPLLRQDIFYTGSVTSLREYKTCPDMATYVQVVILSNFPNDVVLWFHVAAGRYGNKAIFVFRII